MQINVSNSFSSNGRALSTVFNEVTQITWRDVAARINLPSSGGYRVQITDQNEALVYASDAANKPLTDNSLLLDGYSVYVMPTNSKGQ